MYYVAVGEYQAVGGKNKARSSTALFAGLTRAGATGGLMNFNVHHGRTHALNRAGYRAGVSVEQ